MKKTNLKYYVWDYTVDANSMQNTSFWINLKNGGVIEDMIYRDTSGEINAFVTSVSTSYVIVGMTYVDLG